MHKGGRKKLGLFWCHWVPRGGVPGPSPDFRGKAANMELRTGEAGVFSFLLQPGPEEPQPIATCGIPLGGGRGSGAGPGSIPRGRATTRGPDQPGGGRDGCAKGRGLPCGGGEAGKAAGLHRAAPVGSCPAAGLGLPGSPGDPPPRPGCRAGTAGAPGSARHLQRLRAKGDSARRRARLPQGPFIPHPAHRCSRVQPASRQ